VNWHLISTIIPLILLIYLVTIDYVNLFPFNDIAKKTPQERKMDILVGYLPLVLAAIGNWYHQPWSVAIALIVAE
jgi:hypothetical protein